MLAVAPAPVVAHSAPAQPVQLRSRSAVASPPSAAPLAVATQPLPPTRHRSLLHNWKFQALATVLIRHAFLWLHRKVSPQWLKDAAKPVADWALEFAATAGVWVAAVLVIRVSACCRRRGSWPADSRPRSPLLWNVSTGVDQGCSGAVEARGGVGRSALHAERGQVCRRGVGCAKARSAACARPAALRGTAVPSVRFVGVRSRPAFALSVRFVVCVISLHQLWRRTERRTYGASSDGICCCVLVSCTSELFFLCVAFVCYIWKATAHGMLTILFV